MCPILLLQEGHRRKTEHLQLVFRPQETCCMGKTKPLLAALLFFSTQRSGCCDQHRNQALLTLTDLSSLNLILKFCSSSCQS